MRIPLIVRTAALAALVVLACKQRDQADSGLLDDAEPAPAQPEAVAAAGNWRIVCSPQDAEVQDLSYQLDVAGAVSATDETQLVRVSVVKAHAGKTLTLADATEGRGAVAPAGAIFLGFTAGVLTADAPQKDGARNGVLTLAGDAEADGLNVRCLAHGK